METQTKNLLMLLAICFGFTAHGQVVSQANEPVYITMTTMHWNKDPETDFTDWLDTEKEYFDKVTSKNDLIMNSGYYTHYFTPDNSELLFVNVYKSWEDIEKAQEMEQKLSEEAWPDKEKRQAFFEKQRSYYSREHSDEIYTSLPYYKDLEAKSDKPLVYYMCKRDMALDGKGKPEHFKEYFDKVTSKNSKVKAYYTQRHLWGSNGRELAEVFVFDKLSDLEDFFDENEKLMATAWADETERKEFGQELAKLFTGKHSDYIYQSVPELQK
ncbi:hypothetical protein [Zunongwangia sp. H14]|uniref:hypothetical protein n=1 Tax=Zunongwangia sp. H14 TaxID=3240792 RepID=UPI003569ACD9